MASTFYEEIEARLGGFGGFCTGGGGGGGGTTVT